MNQDDKRSAMIKQTRREILRLLEMMYSAAPLKYETVVGSLLHLELDEQYIRDDLTYLVDAGHVSWTNKPERGTLPWHSRFFRLTAQGKRFIDRIERDPHLEP